SIDMRWRILGCLLIFCAGSARAGGPEKNPTGPWFLGDSKERWTFDVLLGAELEPDYVGSDDSEVDPSGFVRAFYKDRHGNRYSLGLEEIGAVFYWGEDDRWALGIDLEFEEGRETENEELRGLPEGRSTLEGEFTLYRRFGNAYGAAVFQPDLLDRGKGLVYFIAGGYDYLTPGERFLVSTRLDISWGDAEHMQTEFGLDEEEGLIIGQPAYTPGGGLKSTSFGVSAQHFFSRRWSWLLGVEVEKYHSKAADSPLIANLGSDVNFEATLGIYFRF
ncbi:MAG: MipA/OmpV family protein, partial [Acidobacteriota bacterium]